MKNIFSILIDMSQLLTIANVCLAFARKGNYGLLRSNNAPQLTAAGKLFLISCPVNR